MLFPSKLASYLAVLLAISSSSSSFFVRADDYSFIAPTAATRWTPGQQGLVSIISSDKATSATPSNDKLLTITLQQKTGIFNIPQQVATIKDHILIVVPFNSTATQISQDITDYVVPLTLQPGGKYFVQIFRPGGFLGLGSTFTSPDFQILAAPITGNTTTLLPTMSSTTMTTATQTSASPSASPTLPVGQTCNDIMEQCAAQGKAYQNATVTTPCSCGAALIVPTIVGNSSPGSVKSNVKINFQSTGGPTAALAVLLLVVMTLF